MKTLTITQAAGLFLFSLLSLTVTGKTFARMHNNAKNTPTHHVSVADVTKEIDMPRELWNGQRGDQPINTLNVTNFIITPGNEGHYNLKFGLPANGTAFVRIVDNGGYDVYFETCKNITTYNKEIDLTSQAGGVYFIQVTQKGKTYTRKLIFS